jgi:aryl-alcohol dehydrogenase-like predicted oxidoreductase
MDYIHLGRSGLSVSRLCLGTMNFGSLTPPAEAEAIMDRAHEIGINFFDTASRYGGAQSPPGQIAQQDQSHPGWTEEIIGDWFAGGGGRRERTVLATKLYGAMGDWPNEGKLAALNIRQACDATGSPPTRICAASSARSRPTWRWPGCCTRRASPGRSSGRAPSTSWTTRGAR